MRPTVIALVCLTACGGESSAIDADVCLARPGVYETVEDLTAATGDCPQYVLDEVADRDPITVLDGRRCGPFETNMGFAIQCTGGAECSGRVELGTVADETGVQDGTVTIVSFCGNNCETVDPACTHTIPVTFEYVSPPPSASRSLRSSPSPRARHRQGRQ